MLAPATIAACHLCGKKIAKGSPIMVAAGTKPRRLAHTVCPSEAKSQPMTVDEVALLFDLIREHEAAEPKKLTPVERFPFAYSCNGWWGRLRNAKYIPTGSARIHSADILQAFAEFIADDPADPEAWVPSIHKGK